MADGRNMNSKFRDSHITGKHSLFEDGAMKANTLMSPRRTGRQRRVRQCSGHVYRLDLLLRQQQNAFDLIMIIIELSYRIVYCDNCDLSYRLSIGNSIWHIITALNILLLFTLKRTVLAVDLGKLVQIDQRSTFKVINNC